ncbi:MAG: hypothetical protein ACK5WS_01980 [Alphaproteobacteria bacterium]|nr:hypothetical protein [Candidatus Jidaibacter sp.]
MQTRNIPAINDKKLDCIVGVSLFGGLINKIYNHHISSDIEHNTVADVIKQLGAEMKVYMTYKPKTFFVEVKRNYHITAKDIELIIEFLNLYKSIERVKIDFTKCQIGDKYIRLLNNFFGESQNIITCDFPLLDNKAEILMKHKNAIIKTTGVIDFKLFVQSENGPIEIHKQWPYVEHFGKLLYTYLSVGNEHMLKSIKKFDISIILHSGVSLYLSDAMLNIARLLGLCTALREFSLTYLHETSILHDIKIESDIFNQAIIEHQSIVHAYYPGMSSHAKAVLKAKDERDNIINFSTL